MHSDGMVTMDTQQPAINYSFTDIYLSYIYINIIKLINHKIYNVCDNLNAKMFYFIHLYITKCCKCSSEITSQLTNVMYILVSRERYIKVC